MVPPQDCFIKRKGHPTWNTQTVHCFFRIREVNEKVKCNQTIRRPSDPKRTHYQYFWCSKCVQNMKIFPLMTHFVQKFLLFVLLIVFFKLLTSTSNIMYRLVFLHATKKPRCFYGTYLLMVIPRNCEKRGAVGAIHTVLIRSRRLRGSWSILL